MDIAFASLDNDEKQLSAELMGIHPPTPSIQSPAAAYRPIEFLCTYASEFICDFQETVTCNLKTLAVESHEYQLQHALSNLLHMLLRLIPPSGTANQNHPELLTEIARQSVVVLRSIQHMLDNHDMQHALEYQLFWISLSNWVICLAQACNVDLDIREFTAPFTYS
jgi:hypothetical protein